MGIMNEQTEDCREIVFDESFKTRFRAPDSSQMVDVAGRCTRCWGALTGRAEGGQWIRIECRVCRRGIDADEAAQEFERMMREMCDNLSRVCKGRGAVYDGNARFVLKILPEMGSDTEAFEERVASAEQKKGRWLTRRTFNKKGTPGYLYIQACTLVLGLRAFPYDVSLVLPSDVDFEKHADKVGELDSDESGCIRYSVQVSPKPSSRDRVQERMGTAMIAGLTAAFACEIAMKAILLTRKDEAEMIHDLKDLYDALQEDCRDRLMADFAEIADIFTEHRQSFGKWRYFEPHLGEYVDKKVIEAIINPARMWGLGKAARVLVDEGLIAGMQNDFHLQYDMDIHANLRVSEEGEVTSTVDHAASQVTARLRIVGHETAIPWDTIMQQ